MHISWCTHSFISFVFIIIIFVFWCALKCRFYLFATYWTHLLKMNKFRHARRIMLIPIPILVDLCQHLVASMTAAHENLSGGLQTLKNYIYVYFDNGPVYDASLLSLWKRTTACKISPCSSCWIKKNSESESLSLSLSLLVKFIVLIYYSLSKNAIRNKQWNRSVVM